MRFRTRNAGRQTLRIDARGNRTTYTLSTIDQVLGRKYPDGSRTTFAYDAVGNRTTMRDGTGRYTYTFDELSRMKTVSLPSTQRLTYAYDAIGQRNCLTAPTGGRFTYSFDAAGRITQVLNPEGNQTRYSYDTAGRRTVAKFANGGRTSYTYDNADQTTIVANIKKSLNGYQSKYDYKYDQAGNRTSVVEESGDRVTWTYDATNQLLVERRSGVNAYRNTFTYDTRGNRTLKNESGSRTTYSYDVGNQLTASRNPAGTRTTYVFDASGNQQVVIDSTSRVTTTWDYENQPTRYNQPANLTYPIVTMAYNADNQRVQKQSPVGTTKFLWDQQNYLAEADGSNAIHTVYTNEPQQFGNLISTRLGTTTYYHQYDALGSTRRLSDSTGSLTGDLWLYDAWGNVVTRTGTTNVFLQWIGALGYYFDTETGLVYVRHRKYRPSVGRWLSFDPRLHFANTHASADVSAFRNPAMYVSNRLLLLVDPSGLAEGWGIELSFGAGYGEFVEASVSLTKTQDTSNCPSGSAKTKYQFKVNVGVALGIGIRVGLGYRQVELIYKSVSVNREIGIQCTSGCIPCKPPIPPVSLCCSACSVSALRAPLLGVWGLPTEIGFGAVVASVNLQGYWQGDVRICASFGSGCSKTGVFVAGCGSLHLQAQLRVLWFLYQTSLDATHCLGIGTGGIVAGGSDGLDW